MASRWGLGFGLWVFVLNGSALRAAEPDAEGATEDDPRVVQTERPRGFRDFPDRGNRFGGNTPRQRADDKRGNQSDAHTAVQSDNTCFNARG